MKRTRSGFTLIEILLVLTLLGVVLTIVGRKVFGTFSRGQSRVAQIQIKQLEGNLDLYRIECGRYPTTEQGLNALVQKPTSTPECKNYDPRGYLDGKDKVPTDPWGYPYQYTSANGSDYEIKSLGKDGAEGGEGEDKDISSKDE